MYYKAIIIYFKLTTGDYSNYERPTFLRHVINMFEIRDTCLVKLGTLSEAGMAWSAESLSKKPRARVGFAVP